MTATAFLIVALYAGAQSAAAPVVTCRADGDPAGRVFRFDEKDGVWRLSFSSHELGDRWLRLKLPNARPEIAADSFRLSYRNANGGRQVDLAVTPAGSALDVWVDHGLEVNIEPDLDPRVDLMNTEGALEGVQCSTLKR